MKRIFILGCLAVFSLAFVACSSSEEEKGIMKTESVEALTASQNEAGEPDTVYTVVDKMPVYAGGDSELLKAIFDNIVYPEEAKKTGTEGRSVVRFCVTKNGNVNNVSILQSSSPELDAEAVRVVTNLPPFESPGYQDGKAVSVWYVVPISFRLK